MKPGTVFRHHSLGVCMIMNKRKWGFTYMSFKADYPDAWFVKNGEPWDESMLLIFKPGD